MKWNEKSDIWSIGTILMEFYTGHLLFPTFSDYEHLAMIEKMRGSVPFWMAKECKNDMKKYFLLDDDEHKKIRGTYFDWPRNAKDNNSLKTVRNLKRLSE